MIYTDGIHMITNGEPIELHTFAKLIGLNRCWFKNHPRHPHYDLFSKDSDKRAAMLYKCLAAGGKMVSDRDLIRIFREKITSLNKYQVQYKTGEGKDLITEDIFKKHVSAVKDYLKSKNIVGVAKIHSYTYGWTKDFKRKVQLS